ncbi:MAG: Gfo/Idh/MocA family protein [Fimbriiglobus sp.]
MFADRREVLAAGVAAAAVTLIPTAVHAKGNDTLKVGLIGCGGRGQGAVSDIMEASKQTEAAVKLWAVADVFESKSKEYAKAAAARYKDRSDVGDRVFGGLDAYQQLIDSGVDLVILATSPGFRPIHLEAAIKAKKHVFTEKPVAVDAPGIRRVLALVEEAKKNGTAVLAGTQRRHQAGYIETVKRIHDGAIGDVVGGRCAWIGQGIWYKPRKAGVSDVEYQLDNWYHFNWVCGGQIVEQHVHNLDVINWVMQAHPVKATAIGGRSYYNDGKPGEANYRDAAVWGNIWDHITTEYTYPNGAVITSFGAHVPNVKTDVSEYVVGTKGTSRVNSYMIGKEKVAGGDSISPYVQEHIDLLKSIQAGKPLNELQSVAESTFTAILGREAAFSGRELKWDELLNTKSETMHSNLTLTGNIPTAPVPFPGKHKIV